MWLGNGHLFLLDLGPIGDKLSGDDGFRHRNLILEKYREMKKQFSPSMERRL